jgi:hypothetical protein
VENLDRPKIATIAAVTLIVALFYVIAAFHFPYTPDDTYIYAQFAKNIVNGGGVAFNAGHPTYGITGPLWMLLIAAGGKVGVDLVFAAKTLDLLFASGAVLLFFFVAFEMTREIATALAATAVFAGDAWFLRWAGTGMETSLAVLLLLAALWYCLRNEYFASIAFAALFALVRPEGVMLVPIILCDLYLNANDKRRAWKMIGVLAAMFLAFLAPWLIYAKLTFGTFVSNTAVAKSSSAYIPIEMWGTFVQLVRSLAFTTVIPLVVLLVSLFAAIRMRKMSGPAKMEEGESFFRFRQVFVALAWAVLLSAVYCIKSVNVVSRYVLLISPMVVLGAFALSSGYLFRNFSGRSRTIAFGVFACLTLGQNLSLFAFVVKPGIDTFESGMESSLIPIGKWLKENTPAESIVFAGDIGAIGYFSERPVCDAAGLISPEMLPRAAAGEKMGKMIEERLFEQCRADYIVNASKLPEEYAHIAGLETVMVKVMPKIDLNATQPTFYTLYRVHMLASHISRARRKKVL